MHFSQKSLNLVEMLKKKKRNLVKMFLGEIS